MNRQQGTDKQYRVKQRKRYVPVMWNVWSLAYTSFIHMHWRYVAWAQKQICRHFTLQCSC